jgi:hypothetical protein
MARRAACVCDGYESLSCAIAGRDCIFEEEQEHGIAAYEAEALQVRPTDAPAALRLGENGSSLEEQIGVADDVYQRALRTKASHALRRLRRARSISS